MYVADLKIDGKKWTRNYIRHSDIVNGGTLRFTMSTVPVETRGTAEQDRPYSLSND